MPSAYPICVAVTSRPPAAATPRGDELEERPDPVQVAHRRPTGHGEQQDLAPRHPLASDLSSSAFRAPFAVALSCLEASRPGRGSGSPCRYRYCQVPLDEKPFVAITARARKRTADGSRAPPMGNTPDGHAAAASLAS